jgi:hypothetical protein
MSETAVVAGPAAPCFISPVSKTAPRPGPLQIARGLSLLLRPSNFGGSWTLSALFCGRLITLPFAIVLPPIALVLFFWSLFLKRPVIPLPAFMSMIALAMATTIFQSALGLGLALRNGYRTIGTSRISRDEQPVRFWLCASADLFVFVVAAAATVGLVWFASHTSLLA